MDAPTRRGIKSAGLLLTVAAPNTAPSDAISDVVTVGGGDAEGETVMVGEGVMLCVGVGVDPGAD